MNFNYNTPYFNKINIPNVWYKSVQNYQPIHFRSGNDSFVSNALNENFGDKNKILLCAKSNPNIMNILKENNLKLDVNYEELENLRAGHLKDTRILSAQMYSALPENLKSEVNLANLQQASMLHDYGKIFIPDKILNKAGKLDENEKKIMELHSILGSELLKTQGINDDVVNLVKYHHQVSDGSGYPKLTDDYTPNISSQILSTADKYSALREKRSYKDALSKDEALCEIYKDVEKGTISAEVFNALTKSV